MSEPLTTAPGETAQADAENDSVIRLGGAPKNNAPVEMVPLFAINGRTYKVPKKVRPNVGLAIISRFEQEGPVAAQMYMMRRLLGQEAMDALLGYDDLEPSELEAIMNRLQEMVFSAAEDDSGN